MIKAVIFDCFGVLVKDGWLPFIEKHFSDDSSSVKTAVDFNKKVDAGLITYDCFIQDVASLAGLTEEQTRQEIEDNPVDEQLFEYIQSRIKPLYKIGLLSNAGDNWLNELFTTEHLSLFDATALSCEIGVIKPDAKAYQKIASLLGVKTQECIFIDDQKRYCQGARDTGMLAIDYVGIDDLNAQLISLYPTK